MVLGGENVAADPSDVGAEGHQCLDEHRGLHSHVQRAGNFPALQRLLRTVFPAQRHQPRHLVLGQLDLLAAELVERQVGDLEVMDGASAVGGEGNAHAFSHFGRRYFHRIVGFVGSQSAVDAGFGWGSVPANLQAVYDELKKKAP